MDWLDLNALALVYCFVVVFFAGLVRGYTGFGLSALIVAGLTLFLPPTQVVPIVLMLEVVASIGMLPSVWREVKWRAISFLLLGLAIGSPFGVYGLMSIPERAAKVVISSIILLASIALIRGYQFKGKGNPVLTLSTGVFAGVVNGLSGVGGLPMVIFFLASGTAAAATRASLVMIFFLLDIYTSFFNVRSGMLGTLELKRMLIFSLPLLLGVFLGSRQFINTNPESFKRLAIYLLIFLATLGLVRVFV